MPPSFDTDMFFGSCPQVMFVKPEYYENYKNNIFDLYRPYILPNDIYENSYIRVISGGTIISDINTITLGGLSANSKVNDYVLFNKPTNNDSEERDELGRILIKLNGTIVGYLKGQYTTIYLGDNSSLFVGDGYNFRYGVYDADVINEMNRTGWYYDEQFEGIRSKNITANSTTFTVKNNTKLDTVPIVFGMYAHTGTRNNYVSINSESDTGDYTIIKSEFNIKRDINVEIGGNINIAYYKVSNTVLGFDGVVINEIGNCRYDESPLYNSEQTKEIKVALSINEANVEIPENIYITITDNKTHTFCKKYSGNTTIFNIVPGYDYIVKVDGFISSEGKVYSANEVNLNGYEEITINFQPSVNGVEIME
jgi:hypothetical protein